MSSYPPAMSVWPPVDGGGGGGASVNDPFVVAGAAPDLTNPQQLASVHGSGTLIARPAQPIPAGYYYFATDTGVWYRSDGANWNSQTPIGTDPTKLAIANNLSDVANVATSRTNLGLGTAATHATTDFLQVVNNLSDLNSAKTARSSTGLNVESTSPQNDTVNYVAVATDRVVVYTGLTVSRSLTLPAASAMNPGQPIIIADGTGNCTLARTITVNRAGADTINGATSVVLSEPLQAVVLISDGASKWTVTPMHAFVDRQEFTSSGTWTKPPGALLTMGHVVAGGGSGAAGACNAAGGTRGGGGGGGAGGVVDFVFRASDLGATETVTLGAGGNAVAGRNTAGSGANGNAGGDSSFGTTIKAICGGAGLGGLAVAGGGTNAAGGGGGAGGYGTRTASQVLGTLVAQAGAAGGGFGAGGNANGGNLGGTGAGGGGGGGLTAGNVASGGGNGGNDNTSAAGGAGGGVNTNGGNAPAPSGDHDLGAGGGGGGASVAGAAGAGGSGAARGGGGGGGGASVTGQTSGGGGAGGNGYGIVYTFCVVGGTT